MLFYSRNMKTRKKVQTLKHIEKTLQSMQFNLKCYEDGGNEEFKVQNKRFQIITLVVLPENYDTVIVVCDELLGVNVNTDEK